MAQVGSAVTNQVASGSSLTLTKTGVTAGNTLFVLISYGLGSSTPLPTLSDSTTQTWTKDKDTGVIGSFNTGVQLWRLNGANAGTHTITMTLPASSYAVGTIVEWAGLVTAAPDVTPVQGSSSTNVTSGSSGTTGTTTQAVDLVLAAICVNPPGGVANDGLTTPSGWTNQQLYTTTSTTVGASHITKDTTVAGTQSASWTWTESSNYAAAIAAYKYASSAAALAASSTALASSTGALTTAIPLAASGTASASSTGALTTAIPLSASSTGQAGSTGDLTTAIALAGSSGAIASTTGAFDATIALAASSTALASSTGSLLTAIAMLAASVAIASSTGALTTGIPLTASSAAAASSTGALTTQITLTGSSAAVASSTGAFSSSYVRPFIVPGSIGKLSQVWQSGTNWSPVTYTLSNVQAGDAIIIFGAWWSTRGTGVLLAPTDSNGAFTKGVDNGIPSDVNPSHPVESVIYYELNAAAGTHVITPPNIGGNADSDGSLYIALVRGLPKTAAVRSTGAFHAYGSSSYANVAVSLASACQIGDFVMAVSCYDNVNPVANVAYTDPPSGWTSIGVDNDGITSVPSEVCYKVATASDTATVTWSWTDSTVNVVDASIIAFIPLSVTQIAASSTASASSTGALQGGVAALAASSAAQASSTGALSTQIPLAASSTTSATGNGSLTTQILLAASSSATSSSSAALTTQIPLVASNTASSATTGNLTTGIPLAGTAISQATAAGALTTQIQLAGNAVATAQGTGTLDGGALFAGNAAAQSMATGNLTTGIPLAGNAAARSVVAGTLTTQIRLAGAAVCQASATGDLQAVNGSIGGSLLEKRLRLDNDLPIRLSRRMFLDRT